MLNRRDALKASGIPMLAAMVGLKVPAELVVKPVVDLAWEPAKIDWHIYRVEVYPHKQWKTATYGGIKQPVEKPLHKFVVELRACDTDGRLIYSQITLLCEDRTAMVCFEEADRKNAKFFLGAELTPFCIDHRMGYVE